MFNNTFDELKEVKYLKEKQISRVLQCKIFKERKRWKSLQKAETCLELKRASMMDLFVNILNGLPFRNKSFIIDVPLGYI